MRTITLDVPDELADQLAPLRDRLPEMLALGLRQPAVPAQIYRAILTFLAGAPTPDQIAAFAPPIEVRQRLDILLDRERAGALTPAERAEIDELERIEHLVVMLKAGALPALTEIFEKAHGLSRVDESNRRQARRRLPLRRLRPSALSVPRCSA